MPNNINLILKTTINIERTIYVIAKAKILISMVLCIESNNLYSMSYQKFIMLK